MKYLLIDYGVSNTQSVERALGMAGFTGTSVKSPKDFQPSKDTLIVLPGVGSYDQGIQNLRDTGWDKLIIEDLLDEYWILGICLGFQLLGKASEEGDLQGLNLLPYKCVRVSSLQENKKSIHSGWRLIDQKQEPNQSINKFFYFTHSYAFNFKEISNNQDMQVLAAVNNSQITSNLMYGKCIGLQFHPEKSHNQGIELLSVIGKTIHV